MGRVAQWMGCSMGRSVQRVGVFSGWGCTAGRRAQWVGILAFAKPGMLSAIPGTPRCRKRETTPTSSSLISTQLQCRHDPQLTN